MIARISLMGTLTLDLLGGFEVRADGGTVLALPTQKYRALLAFLATPPGRAHGRDHLVGLLWSELPHEQARAALRQALWALRRILNKDGAVVLRLEADNVALDAARVQVDVVEFVEAAGRTEPEALARAAALYRGPFLDGVPAREPAFEEWMAAERERLAELALGAHARLLATQRAIGAVDAAIQTALRLLALDPLQEVVHRSLMQLYLQIGRRSAALRQYQHCVGILARELAVEPEEQTRALYQEILRDRSRDFAPATPSLPAAGVIDTPLIGRDQELGRLRRMLTDATAGRGDVAVIVGEAGIGKSRLVTEILNEAAIGGARIVVGRAHETDRVLPLAPWADALRSARLDRDASVLAALQPAWLAEIARLIPELAPAEVPPRGGYDYGQLFEGVVRVVSALSVRCPLVIVLEDVHWADDMTLRLLAFVARRIRARLPVLVLFTARVEELEAAGAFHRVVEDLDLDPVALKPLAREETLGLVRHLAGAHAATVVERLGEDICAASEGHPFMVVEMVRAAEQCAEAAPSGTVTLPQRVRRLIERRFERLGAHAQTLVATAAVIGRDFEYALLHRASGLAEDEAVAGLEELVRRRVCHAVGERFEFTHDRVREVAHSLLLPPRRKLLHRRIAEALECLTGGDRSEHCAALAGHYAEAEVWDRAATRLYEAAQSARDRLAHREAAALLERALDALAHLPRTADTVRLEIDIRLRLFRCLNAVGDSRAADQVAAARALVREVPDDAREAIILVEVAELQRLGRNLQAAIDAAERALVLAEKADQPRLIAPAHFQLGVAHLSRGAYGEAIAHLKATVASLSHAPLVERLGYPYIPALCRLAWALTDLGDAGGARRYADEAATLAETSAHASTIAEASMTAGVLHLAQGRAADAIPLFARARELADAWQLAYLRAFSASWLAYAHAQCGQRAAARPLLDQCERERVWEHVRLEWSRIIVRIARARWLLGHRRRARALADEALALARSIGEPAGEAEALMLLADIAERGASHDAARARWYVEEARRIADRLGLRLLSSAVW